MYVYNSIEIDLELFKQRRQEFSRKSFRDKLKREKGEICCNCRGAGYIEYHHIVPLRNGGTNNLSNIVPLCGDCHLKAHSKTGENKSGGRPPIIEYKDAAPILKRYFDNKTGKKETALLLGLSHRTKDTWYKLTKQYKKENNVPKYFRNNIDILAAQEKRLRSNKEKRKKAGIN